jgi:hypothetical protein
MNCVYYDEYEICLSDFFLVSLVSEIDVIQGSLMCIPGPLRLSNSGLVIFHLITYFPYFPLWDKYYGIKNDV